MSLDSLKEKRLSGVIKAVLVLSLGLSLVWAAALPALAARRGEAVGPSRHMVVSPVQVRTPAEMAATEAAIAGKAPASVKVPFRPTIPAATYQAHKAKAATRAAAAMAGAAAGKAPLAPANLVVPPKVKGQNFEGVNSKTAGNFLPPDTHGAVGLNHFVEITNSHLDIYKKSNHSRVKSLSLAKFFGYFTPYLFDVRVIYDQAEDRWIISSDSLPDPKTGQHHWLAVSQTSDPRGAYFIYAIPVNDGTGTEFWDFPQLGMDQNAILITANVFDETDTFSDGRLLVVRKFEAYNGLPLYTSLFDGLEGSIAPPIVLDDNDNTFLVAAAIPAPPVTETQVTLYTLTDSGGDTPLLDTSSIDVDPYGLPPNAPQGGKVSVLLDTMDCRFANASTQVGDSLFQVHTIDDGSGFARPRYYEFDTFIGIMAASGDFSRSTTSYDFNASIAANASRDVFVTWSATDPVKKVNAEVRFSGRLHDDPEDGIASPGVRLATSVTYYNPFPEDIYQRWGDYSAVSIDPVDPTKAWIVNERIRSRTSWGSRIGRIGY